MQLGKTTYRAMCSVSCLYKVWHAEDTLPCLSIAPPLCSVTRLLELYKEFQEEAHSVALHPSGLFILVGFSDKLRLMNLLIDDIRTVKEFTVRGCREVGHVMVTSQPHDAHLNAHRFV